MNARKLLFVGCMLASVVLLTGASPVWAAYYEDFEGYPDGALAGNSGWYVGNVGNLVAPGSGVNTTQTVGLSGGFLYDWDSTVAETFTAADTAVVFSIHVFSGTLTGDTMKVGFETGATEFGPALTLGVEKDGKSFCGMPNGNGNGDAGIVADHWYEMKWVVDFSVLGGVGTVSRRDLTSGTAWVVDTVFNNVALGFPGPTYDFQRVLILSFTDDTAVDNLSIEAVPDHR